MKLQSENETRAQTKRRLIRSGRLNSPPIETKHKCLISAFACDSLAPLASYALRIDMELELQLLSGGNQRKR